MSETEQAEAGGASAYHHHGGNPPPPSRHNTEVLSEARIARYWRANLRLLGALLAIWFVVSFGFGILLAAPLNDIRFFGFPLGFWWAQQGAIFVFIALIFVYAAAMRRIERAHGVGDI